MHMFDIVVGGILLLLAIHGFRKGLISTVMHLVALGAGVIVAGRYTQLLAVTLHAEYDFPFALSKIIAVLIIFVVIFIISRLVSLIFTRILKALNLNIINRFLGAALGIANGLAVLILIIAIVGVNEKATDKIWKKGKGSHLAPLIQDLAEEVIVENNFADMKARVNDIIEDVKKQADGVVDGFQEDVIEAAKEKFNKTKEDIEDKLE